MKKLLIFGFLIVFSEAVRYRPPRLEDDEDLKPVLTESEKADIEVEK